MKIDKELSNWVYGLRMIAIISVVIAHTSILSDNKYVIKYLFSYFSIIGVALFYILSGFFFYFDKSSTKKFVIKKLKRLVVPWFSLGTVVYIYMYIRKDDYMNYIDFIFGNGSYLYFMTVLLIFYILFYKFRNNSYFIVISFIVSLLYVAVPFGLYSNAKMPLYMFPLNYMLYFSFGLFLAQKNLLKKFIEKCIHYRTIIAILYIISLFVLINNDILYPENLLFKLLGILLVFAYINQISKLSFSKSIGENTLSIYLLHMPFAGAVSYLANIVDNIFVWAISPVLILILTYSLIQISTMIAGFLFGKYETR